MSSVSIPPAAAFLVLLGLTVWTAGAAAQCVDYTEYLHEAASVYHEGDGRAVAVRGTICVAATNDGVLRIIEIADPEHPQELATIPLQGSFNAIALSGDLAVVAAGNTGVHVVDLTEPTTPVLRGTVATDPYAFDVAVVGDHAYVAAGAGDLFVLAITPDGPPQVVNQFATPGYPFTVAASGEHLYLGDCDSGLRVYDLSGDPADPALVGVVPTVADVVSIDTSGDRLAAQLGDEGIAIYSLTDPDAPLHVADLDNAYGFRGLALGASSLYVAAGDDVLAYDLASPDPPRFQYPLIDQVFAVAVAADGLLAVAAEGRTVLLADGNPELHRPTDNLTGLNARDMVVTDGFAYVATLESLVVLDVDDPANLRIHGTLALAEYARHLVLLGSTVVVSRHDQGLMCIDVSDPGNPTPRGMLNDLRHIDDLAVVNGLVAVLHWEGLALVDVSDPDAPLLVSNTVVSGSCLAAQGDLLYVAATHELSVIDVADPLAPTLVGTLDYTGATAGLGLNGRWLYMTTNHSLLHVVDLADPTAPVIRGTLPVHGWGSSYAFDGSYVYGNFWGAGRVHLFDMSDPDAPRLVAQARVGTWPYAMQRHGEYILTAGENCYSLPRHCDDPLTSIAVEPPAAAAARLVASPNPCNPHTTFRFTLPTAAIVEMNVYDLAGRRLRTLAAASPRGAGPHAMLWDGRDDAGRSVPSGVYLGRLEAGTLRATARVVVVR